MFDHHNHDKQLMKSKRHHFETIIMKKQKTQIFIQQKKNFAKISWLENVPYICKIGFNIYKFLQSIEFCANNTPYQ